MGSFARYVLEYHYRSEKRDGEEEFLIVGEAQVLHYVGEDGELAALTAHEAGSGICRVDGVAGGGEDGGGGRAGGRW